MDRHNSKEWMQSDLEEHIRTLTSLLDSNAIQRVGVMCVCLLKVNECSKNQAQASAKPIDLV